MSDNKKLSTQQMTTHFSYVLKEFPVITKSITHKTELGEFNLERIEKKLNVYYDSNDFVTIETRKRKNKGAKRPKVVMKANEMSLNDACVDNTLRDPVAEEYYVTAKPDRIDPNGSDKEYDNGQKVFVKCFFENILENDNIMDKLINKITERATALRNVNLNEWFLSFWDLWPKGALRGSKANAWKKIQKINPSKEECEEIEKGAKENILQYELMDKYHQWHPDLPMVTTWLTQERWKDTYVTDENHWKATIPNTAIKKAREEKEKENIVEGWDNLFKPNM